MAANKGQGRSFAVLLIGLLLACAGMLNWSGGSGKLMLLVGVVVFIAGLAMAKGLKAGEGRVAQRPGAEGGKIAGGLLALCGWLITVVGIQVVTSTGGRMLVALVGIATSLFGIIVVLPAAINKNAIWKA